MEKPLLLRERQAESGEEVLGQQVFRHGCVFSLLNSKPFVTALSDYRSNKIADLARTAGAERHVMSQETRPAEYEAVLAEGLDPAIIHRLAELRRQSRIYLTDVLA